MSEKTVVNPGLTEQRGALSVPQGNASVHLDALRGFAAFSVMISHWRLLYFADYVQLPKPGTVLEGLYFLTGLGHQWVIVFFVLSGYLVGGSVLRAVEGGRFSWRQYLFVRLTRLYVVLIPALALAAILFTWAARFPGWELVFDLTTGQHEFIFNPLLTRTWPTFLGNLFFLQGFRLPGMQWSIPSFSGDGPLWSLSYELWYYVGFPILVLMLARGRSIGTRVFYLLLMILWCWGNGWERIVMGIPWLLGAMIYFLPRIRVSKKWQKWALQISALVLLVAGLMIYKLWFNLTTTVVIGFIVTYLIWVVVSCSKGKLWLGYIEVSRWSAHSSYTLYLVHLPFLVLMKAAFHLTRIDHFEMRHTIITAFLLPATLLFSHLVYWCFERNTDAIRKWLAPFVLKAKRI